VRFLDSHVHLSDYPAIAPLVEYCRSSETLLFSVSTDGKSSARSIALGRRYKGLVRPFVGVHPSEATAETSLVWLEEAIPDASGIGEVGLDPRYSEVAQSSPQMKIFSEQLALAEKSSKSIQIHSRRAERICLETLPSFRLSRVLLHWFESEELCSVAASKGYYVSVGPALLRSKRLARLAVEYPVDLLLAESDGPVSFAALGGVGGPALVPSVVFSLAYLKRTSFFEMAEVLLKNGLAFLG